MSSPDHPEDDGPSPAVPVDEDAAEPVERSTRGRIVIRSSSHPPRTTQPGMDSREVSGARALPGGAGEAQGPPAESEEARSKKSTPAERPRKRRQVQAVQGFSATLPARPERLGQDSERDRLGADRAWSAVAGDPESIGAPDIDHQDSPAAREASARSGQLPAADVPQPLAPDARGLRARSALIAIAVIALASVLFWALLRRH